MKLLELLSNQVVDDLPRVVHDNFRQIDPIYKYIDQSATASVDADTAHMGYRWRVNHTFGGGISGIMQSANPEGPDVYNSGGSPYTSGLSGSGITPFPSALGSPHLQVVKRTLTLHRNTGNFNIPIDWLQHDKLDAAHIKNVARTIQAVGRGRAHKEAVSLFCKKVAGDTGATDYSDSRFDVLGTVGSEADYSYDGTAIGKTIGIDDGRIMYFLPNMIIQILTNDGGAVDANTPLTMTIGGTAYSKFIVTNVDYISDSITILPYMQSDGTLVGSSYGGEVASDNIATDAYIVWDGWQTYTTGATTGVYPMVTWGLDDWIKDSGYLFNPDGASVDSFSLALHPNFKSYVNSVNGSLTDSIMNARVGKFVDAYGQDAPDTLITTWGVILKYLESPNASGLDRMSFDRTGKSLDVNGGFSEVKYSFNGRNMKLLISSMCQPGTMYALKLGDGNLKRYVPPKASAPMNGKSASDSSIGGEVQFLTKLTSESIFKIAEYVTATSAGTSPTNVLEAPFWQDRLLAPMDVRSIKLTDITEASTF